MAIATINTDYTGRKRDVSILQYPQPEALGPNTVRAEFGKVSRFTAGPQKLVQQVAVVFLTALGTQTNFPDFGADFINKLHFSANTTTLGELTPAFALAKIKVETDFQKYQRRLIPAPPLDEQLAYLELVDASIVGTQLSLTIGVHTQAGETINYILPVPRA